MVSSVILASALFIAPAKARELPDVQIVDARSYLDYKRGHAPGAIRIDWKSYRDGWTRVGRLPSNDEKTAKRLEKAGISTERPVVVIGTAIEGWGDEGRIAWMLLYLGHPDVHILDGGWKAWVDSDGEVTKESPSVEAAHFELDVQPELRFTHADLLERFKEVTVLDVRTQDEYDGKTPYLSKRGGHVPGAKHLYWHDLFDESGTLKHDLKDRLTDLGLKPEAPIAVYCTGGIRSAMATLALRDLGYDARNYDGGWWEWSADDNAPVETKE